MSRKAIRLPNPDLITPFATKKAANIRTIKISEKTEKAFSSKIIRNSKKDTNAIRKA